LSWPNQFLVRILQRSKKSCDSKKLPRNCQETNKKLDSYQDFKNLATSKILSRSCHDFINFFPRSYKDLGNRQDFKNLATCKILSRSCQDLINFFPRFYKDLGNRQNFLAAPKKLPRTTKIPARFCFLARNCQDLARSCKIPVRFFSRVSISKTAASVYHKGMPPPSAVADCKTYIIRFITLPAIH
jgi:hypothetical protein